SSLFDLNGRIALVTGGGTGIGYMIARGLVANGARVYISGRRRPVLAKAAQEFEGRGELAAADGRLDILVNNAGQSGPRSTWMSDASAAQNEDASAPQRGDAEALGVGLFAEEQGLSLTGKPETKGNWAGPFATNTFALFFVTTASIGLLAKGSDRHGTYSASVINVTSMSGSLKLAWSYFAYGASKAVIAHLTKMLPPSSRAAGSPYASTVRLTALAPGQIESEIPRGNLYHKVTDGLAQKIGLQPVSAGRIGGWVRVGCCAMRYER
ncbi:NAD(P)-binding protein, partial [Schizophyllum commune Loenen D]